MKPRSQLAEIARSLAPGLLRLVLGLAVLVGLIVLVSFTGWLFPWSVIVVVVGPLVMAGAVLGRPMQLVATSAGIRFGGAAVVPWPEVAAIYVHHDRKRVVDGSEVARRAAATDPDPDTAVSAQFYCYLSRRLLRSPRPTLYFSFDHWWTRYRLPLRMSLQHSTHYVSGNRAAWWRPRNLDVQIWIEGDPQQLVQLVAQLEAIRVHVSEFPAAFAVSG